MLTIYDMWQALAVVKPSAKPATCIHIWRALVAHTGKSLVVSCLVCEKAYGLCRCTENGEAVDALRWRYFATKPYQNHSQIRNWGIGQASLAKLRPEQVITQHSDFRELVMCTVRQMLVLGEPAELLTISHFRLGLRAIDPVKATRPGRGTSSLWRNLIAGTDGRLKVECLLCKKSYNERECRCPENGALVGSGWRYFVDKSTQSAAQMAKWGISRASLEELLAATVQAEKPEASDLVIRVVAEMLKPSDIGT